MSQQRRFYPEQGRKAGVPPQHYSDLKDASIGDNIKVHLESWVEDRKDDGHGIRLEKFITGSNVEEGSSSYLEMVRNDMRCNLYKVVEMETYAVFLACKVFRKPCLGSFKAVSDHATAAQSAGNRDGRLLLILQ